jgi:hypothetical protein
MTTNDANDAGATDRADDDSLPFAVRVMIVLIVLSILGVVVVDILHFAGAF